MSNLTTSKTLLTLNILLMLVFGIIGENNSQLYDYFWGYLLFVLFVLAFFYLPLIYLYQKRKKANADTSKINKVFRIANYVGFALTILPFIFECYITFYSYYSDVSFFENLWGLIQYHLSFKHYILEPEVGLWYDIKQILPALPFLIVSINFLLINKFNKNESKKDIQKD